MLASLLLNIPIGGAPARRYILPDGSVTTDVERVRVAFLESEPVDVQETQEKAALASPRVQKVRAKKVERFIKEAEVKGKTSSDSEAFLAILWSLD